MANELSFTVQDTQRNLDILFHSMTERLERGGEFVDLLERQRDELLLLQSRTQEREIDLNHKISEQEERARELERLRDDALARARESSDEHVREKFMARTKVKKLGTQMRKLEQDTAAAIPEEWAKAQLLRHQKVTLSKRQTEINELRASL